MEFLQDHSLHQFANQPLPAARAINIAIQVCGAMQAAHQCGIVHRDLSINNIMLLDNHHNDYIKVIDFGLSFFSGKTTQSITETGALVGSLYYMSPEQCNGQKIDHRADIYALGCILFQLVAGVAPFQADNPIAMLKQHLHACAPPLNTFVPEHEIPVGLQSALCRAMNKNPEQRFQSMQDFQTELEAILRGEGLDVDVDVGEADAGAAKRLRRFGLVAAILCSAGLILTGYLYRLPDLSSAKVGKHPLYKRNKTESELQKMDSDSRIENHKEWLRCHTNEVSERAAYKAVSLAEEVQGSTPETAGKYLREAFAITHRWLEQSLEQEQYSQIQGATNLLQHLQ